MGEKGLIFRDASSAGDFSQEAAPKEDDREDPNFPAATSPAISEWSWSQNYWYIIQKVVNWPQTYGTYDTSLGVEEYLQACVTQDWSDSESNDLLFSLSWVIQRPFRSPLSLFLCGEKGERQAAPLLSASDSYYLSRDFCPSPVFIFSSFSLGLIKYYIRVYILMKI